VLEISDLDEEAVIENGVTKVDDVDKIELSQ
jgi:hypothetical protein